MKILLISGHGQGDPGACSRGYQEATLTRELVSALSTILKQYADVTVFDTDLNMYKYLKTKTFDFRQYDYVLEIHFNACVNDVKGNGKTTGVEILVHPSEKGTTVEELIVDNISKIGFTNRGVKARSNLQNMNICKGKQGVSYALLETCFIDDADDMKLYNARKSDVVMATAEGIIKGFGLKTKAVADEGIQELVTPNDIVWELGHRGFVTDTKGMLDEMNKNPDGRLYWLARKMLHYIRTKKG